MFTASAEFILRLVPIPGIAYHSYCYDELTGAHLYPNSKKLYRSARGDAVIRKVNDWGYLDVDHSLEPPPRSMRVGFFGDSYTEAAQVPIEDTFFRLLEDALNDSLSVAGHNPVERIETLAFGLAGRSTIQSYLECARWMKAAAIDYVVYVFCENDMSDNIRGLTGSLPQPYAYLDGDSFRVDNSFLKITAHKKTRWHRAWQFTKAHSLALSTLQSRLRLLKRHGLKMRATPEDMHAEAVIPAKDGRLVTGTSPSTWPSDSLLAYGETLAERIMDRWHTEVTAAGNKFVIMYVPKQLLLGIPIEEQDSWAGWLHAYCGTRGIPLIDPSEQLLAHKNLGEEVYYDHFTSSGHRAVAGALIDFFLE